MKDDVISRKAAIDALGKIFPIDPMRNDYTQGIACGAALATEYIKQLPSAQSEIEKKIKDIGYTGKEGKIYIGGRLFAVRELAQ